MAARSMWTGSLDLSGFLVPVSVVKATDDPKFNEGLKRVCSCCHQPFTQDTKCPAGRRPARKGEAVGGDIAGIAYAVGYQDGQENVVIPADDLEAIDELTASKSLEIDVTVPKDSLPLHYVKGAHFLKPNDKVHGADKPFGLLMRALEDSGSALISKWRRASEDLVAIVVENGEALMLTLQFSADVRELERKATTWKAVELKDAEIKMANTLVGALSGPLDLSKYENEHRARRQAHIDQYLTSGSAPTPAAPVPDAAPDLMGALTASIEAARQKSEETEEVPF